VGDGSDTGTAGTVRALTEQMILDASQKIWDEGGKANKIMCNGTMKQAISQKFKGRATSIDLDSSNNKISQAVDFYETDFGSY
ncbi:SU10 major capsid protein, partial [Streptococcus pyogenes]